MGREELGHKNLLLAHGLIYSLVDIFQPYVLTLVSALVNELRRYPK